MTRAIVWITCALVAVVSLNLWATVAIARDTHLAKKQKIVQMAVTWLLPFLGAAIALSVQHFTFRQKDRPFGDSSLVVEDRHYIDKGYF
jgi:hypothetical protein